MGSPSSKSLHERHGKLAENRKKTEERNNSQKGGTSEILAVFTDCGNKSMDKDRSEDLRNFRGKKSVILILRSASKTVIVELYA